MSIQTDPNNFVAGHVAIWIAAAGAWAAAVAVLWLARRANQLMHALHHAERERAAASARTAAYFFYADIAQYKVQLEMAQNVVEHALKDSSMSLSEVQRLLKGRISLPSLANNPAVVGQLPNGLTVQLANLASEVRAGAKGFEEFELSAALHPDQSVEQSEDAHSGLQAMRSMLGPMVQCVRTAEHGLSKFIYPEQKS